MALLPALFEVPRRHLLGPSKAAVPASDLYKTLARVPDELTNDEEPATADSQGLRRFIESGVLPWFQTRRQNVANRPLICDQAFGASLDPEMLDRLVRYAVHLGQLERT